MTENHESAADEQPRKGSTAPGLEGEGGQYVDGDYGDAGAVEDPPGLRDHLVAAYDELLAATR